MFKSLKAAVSDQEKIPLSVCQCRGQQGYGEEGTVLLFTDLSCLFYRGELYGQQMPILNDSHDCLVKSQVSLSPG